jgi:hypothetical protein
MCGKEISPNAVSCPHCGEPIINKATTKDSIQLFTSSKWFTAVIITVGIIIAAFIYSTSLFGNDKIAFNLIKEAAYDFKDPSSVRVVKSGRIGVDKDALWVTLSAINGFGARGSGCYFIGTLDDGEIFAMEEDSPIFCDIDANDFNVNKVNRALENFFK